MKPVITKAGGIPEGKSFVAVLQEKPAYTGLPFSSDTVSYLMKRIRDGKKIIDLSSPSGNCYVVITEKNRDPGFELELMRRAGHRIYSLLEDKGITDIYVSAGNINPQLTLAFTEGLALSSYRFTRYLTEKKRVKYRLRKIRLVGKNLKAAEIEKLNILADANFRARDLVNEPVSSLNAARLGEEFISMGAKAGFFVEVFNRKKIESLRMGGLLAVNKGSIDPPTFTVMEWKPENAINKKPYILVGKGVMYDTGGLSLKPTKNSMDEMKSDMAGGAAVGCTLYAISLAKLPVHVIGLVPATDNRLDGNSYAPGDIVVMHSGTTVEVMNTDAEGRMILADALSYAKLYNPGLVINLATLTGSASIAIGHFAMVGMGNAPGRVFNRLKQSGEYVHEKIVEFPFWNDYKEQLKSDIADLKNVGGRYAGAITAGKFLEYFTSYPFIHLDIAGCSFLEKEVFYRGKGGTGVGVRLLFDFFENISK